LALRQFETEIAWMQENTDGLIIDVMRNNGGDACYNEEIQRRLIPYTFSGIGREIRATRAWVNSFSEALELARQQRAEPHVIALLEARLQDIITAYGEARARTGSLPICTAGLERLPADIVYRKPLMVLIDEFSTSAADAFPAVLQDARRGPLFGMRTRGAGGTIRSYRFGVFSEAFTSATIAMHHRLQPVVTSDYPTAPYVENIGVRPDIEYDYMTLDNLLNGGSQFVSAFTAAMLEHIRSAR
jgi:C-terminal processing protease CtpA/Prc